MCNAYKTAAGQGWAGTGITSFRLLPLPARTGHALARTTVSLRCYLCSEPPKRSHTRPCFCHDVSTQHSTAAHARESYVSIATDWVTVYAPGRPVTAYSTPTRTPRSHAASRTLSADLPTKLNTLEGAAPDTELDCRSCKYNEYYGMGGWFRCDLWIVGVDNVRSILD